MIHRAVSPGDPRLEPFRHVGDHGWLRERQLFVAEGRLVVRRLVESGRFEVAAVLVTAPALAALEPALAAADADVLVCDEPTLAAITGFRFHQGCLALARRPSPVPPGTLYGASTLLALEGVGNPDNIGGLFRAAAAFGAGGLLLDGRCGDPFYRKAIRTSMGSVLSTPYARIADWPRDLATLKSEGFTIVALTPRADAIDLPSCAKRQPRQRLALLVGSEGPGLTSEAEAMADVCVRIPISAAVDSLNLATATGIALYYFTT